MAKFSIRYTSDFSPTLVYASWAVFSLMTGLLAWVLGIGVPRIPLFPAPMIHSITYQGPAYASIVSAFGVSILGAIYLSTKIRVAGINSFLRFVAILTGAGAAVVLAAVNPFVYSGYISEVMRTLLLLGDWVAIGLVGTILSFVFAHGLAIGLGRH
ncbi:hypothetical protein [Pseudomonas aeruginosa]|jgi:hypothetical protein|uniref:hypothetical protein n=1 Tax=Pseudomonas aeruginosa TaxID=287 RepID=UPI00104F8505|nr:hypothetical protein [Pseudomonas aeruginosa]